MMASKTYFHSDAQTGKDLHLLAFSSGYCTVPSAVLNRSVTDVQQLGNTVLLPQKKKVIALKTMTLV